MNSEVKGREIIDSIPVGKTVAGYFRVNEIPYGVKESLGKWNLLKSIMFHRDDVHVEKCDSSIKVHLLGKNATIEAHYVSDMFREFTCLMGYFTVLNTLESKSVEMVNVQNRGVHIFNELPDNAKGLFSISDMDESMLEDIRRKLYRPTGDLSCVLYNRDNDVIIHKGRQAVLIDYPMLGKKEEIHYGTSLWNIFAQLFSVFILVKDLGPNKEEMQDVQHVSDVELYNAMSAIQNYCLAHCHDHCASCALHTNNGHCFTEDYSIPGEWNLCPPNYRVFR